MNILNNKIRITDNFLGNTFTYSIYLNKFYLKNRRCKILNKFLKICFSSKFLIKRQINKLWVRYWCIKLRISICRILVGIFLTNLSWNSILINNSCYPLKKNFWKLIIIQRVILWQHPFFKVCTLNCKICTSIIRILKVNKRF